MRLYLQKGQSKPIFKIYIFIISKTASFFKVFRAFRPQKFPAALALNLDAAEEAKLQRSVSFYYYTLDGGEPKAIVKFGEQLGSTG